MQKFAYQLVTLTEIAPWTRPISPGLRIFYNVIHCVGCLLAC